MQIPGLAGMRPGELGKRSVREFLRNDMTTCAAALAYHVLFALFPFVIFLVALLGFLNIPQFFDGRGDLMRAAPRGAVRTLGSSKVARRPSNRVARRRPTDRRVRK